jgi:hypothetical protein
VLYGLNQNINRNAQHAKRLTDNQILTASGAREVEFLVETHNILQVANAVKSARKHVYHTNGNCAHEELRDLLKSGQCRDTGEVIAYFYHIKFLTASTETPLKINVSLGDCTGLNGIVRDAFSNEILI